MAKDVEHLQCTVYHVYTKNAEFNLIKICFIKKCVSYKKIYVILEQIFSEFYRYLIRNICHVPPRAQWQADSSPSKIHHDSLTHRHFKFAGFRDRVTLLRSIFFLWSHVNSPNRTHKYEKQLKIIQELKAENRLLIGEFEEKTSVKVMVNFTRRDEDLQPCHLPAAGKCPILCFTRINFGILHTIAILWRRFFFREKTIF